MNSSLAIKINSEGGVTNYAYHTLNRLTGLTDFNSKGFTFSYDALGRRISLVRPNGVSTSYQYDSLSRLLSILHQSSAFTSGTTYAYDAAGNRTSRTDTSQPTGGSLTQTVTNYSYDSIYELTQAVVNGTTAETYTYDAVGNRLSSLGIPSYSYNSSNELTSIGKKTFSYDANGNTLTKAAPNGTTSYTWDFENRLTSVTLPKGSVLRYQYDPFGRRIFSDGTGRIFVYDGDNVTEDLDLTGKAVARYTDGLGIDEPLEETASGSSDYYEADGLGSVTSLTDGSGSVANSYAYSSFGSVTASSSAVSNRFFFTARENVAKTGLLYYRARYYDPSVGRFLSEDPIRFAGLSNFYPYSANDPVNLIDPSGLQHSPGGPEHPDPWVEYRCRWSDDCATLSAKIDIFKKVIADHLAWDAAHGGTTHTDNLEIPNFQNGLNRCIRIHRIKCTSKGPCEPPPAPVPVPSPQGFPPPVPALPPPSPATTLGVGSILLIIVIIAFSPVGA